MVIELRELGLLRLPKLHGARLVCVEGALWITHDNDPNDLVLQPGAEYALSRNGALVQALRASRFSIEVPDATPHFAFSARNRGLLPRFAP